MILNKKVFLFLFLFLCVNGFQAALAAKPMACLKLFSETKEPVKKTKIEKPKEALPVEITDADSFAEAMTKGMLLNSGQGDLFGIYLAMYLGDPKTSLEGNSFSTVQQILQTHPDLQKTHFPEYEISKVVKLYESSESLNQYVRGQLSAAGQVRSNLFQIEANIGFWKKILDYTDLKTDRAGSKEIQKQISEKNKIRFFKYLSKVISAENRDLLKDEKVEYETKIAVLFKTLDQLKSHFEKNKKDSKAIRQAMVDLVHTTGYLNLTTVSLLKSQDGLQRVEGLNKIIDERDAMAMRLGYDGHFVELLKKLDISFPSLTGVPEASTSALLSSLEKEVKKGKFTTKTTDSVRVRSLSIQEAGFRSCLGGSDCSSRTYFSKAFDPNYHYFTMTDKQNKSSGHATIVLGSALDVKGKTVKVAFLDKLQNVPDQLVIEFLQAVQKSLKEKGYKLGIPEDLTGHNGLSNMSNTLSYIKQNIIPHVPVVLTGFTPEDHSYNFPNKYSRAYDKLPMRVFDMKPTVLENTEIRPGILYKPYAANPNLSKESLVAKFLALKNSKNPDEIMQYITGIRTVEFLQKQNLYTKNDFLYNLEKFFKDSTNSFKIRKTAWFELYQNSDWRMTNFISNWMDAKVFSINERTVLIKEIKDWGTSTNQNRQIFSRKFFLETSKMGFDSIKNRGDRSIEDLKLLLECRLIDAKIKDIDGNTLFHYAVKAGAIEVAKFLATVPGIELNEKNKAGQSAVQQVWGETSVTMQLLKIPGVDVNATSVNGETVLQVWVANRNHLPKNADRIKFLLSLPGINKNTKNDHGTSVLVDALNDKEVLKLFLAEPGIDFNVVDSDGNNLLTIARLEKDVELFSLLLKARGIKLDADSARHRQHVLTNLLKTKDDAEGFQAMKSLLNVSEIDRTTPLEAANLLFPLAAGLNDVAAMEKLLEIPGININHAIAEDVDHSPYNSTAIEIATIRGSAKAVEFLLRQKNLKIRNFDGYEGLLYSAVRGDHFEVFEMLLKHPEARTGPWPLFRAMQAGSAKNIYFEKLLQIPVVNLNAPEFKNHQESLLLQTFNYGSLWHLQHLLKLPGIDVNYRHTKKFSDGEILNGETFLVKLIRTRSNYEEQLDYIDVLLADPRIDANILTDARFSALLFMLDKRTNEAEAIRVIKKLLPRMNEQTINFVSPRIGTALTLAKKYWSDEVVEILKQAGAHE